MSEFCVNQKEGLLQGSQRDNMGTGPAGTCSRWGGVARPPGLLRPELLISEVTTLLPACHAAAVSLRHSSGGLKPHRCQLASCWWQQACRRTLTHKPCHGAAGGSMPNCYPEQCGRTRATAMLGSDKKPSSGLSGSGCRGMTSCNAAALSSNILPLTMH